MESLHWGDKLPSGLLALVLSLLPPLQHSCRGIQSRPCQKPSDCSGCLGLYTCRPPGTCGLKAVSRQRGEQRLWYCVVSVRLQGLSQHGCSLGFVFTGGFLQSIQGHAIPEQRSSA